MNTSQLVENLINELNIGTRSLAKLLDVSPTTIHRWINEEVTISSEKLNSLQEVHKTILTLAKSSKCNPDEIIKALIELKQSPLWKGWDHAIKMLGGIELTLQSEDYIKKHLLQNFDHLGDNLRQIKRIPNGVDIDALFKDQKGTAVAVKFYNKPVATDEYGRIKIIVNSIIEKIGKRHLLVLVAPRFLGSFAMNFSQEKNLKLLQYDLNLTEISL